MAGESARMLTRELARQAADEQELLIRLAPGVLEL